MGMLNDLTLTVSSELLNATCYAVRSLYKEVQTINIDIEELQGEYDGLRCQMSEQGFDGDFDPLQESREAIKSLTKNKNDIWGKMWTLSQMVGMSVNEAIEESEEKEDEEDG